MEHFDPELAAGILLKEFGSNSSARVIPLPGGRNNRVWLVDSPEDKYLLKHYFWSEADPRDRLGQEWAFLEYLWSSGCRQAPKPIAMDRSLRCALLEFIEGTPVPAHEVSGSDIEEALVFFSEINAHRAVATHLSPVSEACFSLESHLATTAERVRRLELIQPIDEAHESAIQLFKERIQPLWQILEKHILVSAQSDLKAVLPIEARCLSPSDFGFHNALLESSGQLRFVDFEYAGWDDPAKTIIDFCNQPDGLLPAPLAETFRNSAITLFRDPADLAHRISILEPVYQIKWACICLNPFLPGRSFPPSDSNRSPSAQLSRARRMADRAAKQMSGINTK